MLLYLFVPAGKAVSYTYSVPMLLSSMAAAGRQSLVPIAAPSITRPQLCRKTSIRCPSDHTLRRKVAAAAFNCSRCRGTVDRQGVLWQCGLGCDFSLCHACCCPEQAVVEVGQSDDAVFGPSLSALALSPQSLLQSNVPSGNVDLHESALLLEVANPCGIYKQPVTAHSSHAWQRSHCHASMWSCLLHYANSRS